MLYQGRFQSLSTCDRDEAEPPDIGEKRKNRFDKKIADEPSFICVGIEVEDNGEQRVVLHSRRRISYGNLMRRHGPVGHDVDDADRLAKDTTSDTVFTREANGMTTDADGLVVDLQRETASVEPNQTAIDTREGREWTIARDRRDADAPSESTRGRCAV